MKRSRESSFKAQFDALCSPIVDEVSVDMLRPHSDPAPCAG